MTSKTIAHQIADMAGNSGITWETTDGRSLGDVLADQAIRIRHANNGDVYYFADDSAIVTRDSGWDIVGEEP